MGITATLAVVGKVDVQPEFGEIVEIPSFEGIPSSFASQVVRVFLPAMYPGEVCLISDIDMLPLSRDYFLKTTESLSNDQFAVLTSDAYPGEVRYPMCYLSGLGKTFADILGIERTDDSALFSFLREWQSHDLGWSTDEILFARKLHEWRCFEEKTVLMERNWRSWQSTRIDRSIWHVNRQKLACNEYVDAHMPRPLHKHQRKLKLLFEYVECGNEGGKLAEMKGFGWQSPFSKFGKKTADPWQFF